MKTVVIILNFNGKQDTLECLASLKEAQKNHPFSILVVDNGSDDGSLPLLKEKFPEELFLDNVTNLGYAEGNNRGIVYAIASGFDAICLLNNDTVVDPFFLKALYKKIELHPKSILGATPYLYSDRSTLDHLGGIWNLKKGIYDLIGHRKQMNQEETLSLDYVCGCCLFAKKELFEDVGYFDPRFFLFWEESDLCERAKKKGYSILNVPEAKLWHKVSASFLGGKPHTTYYFSRNRLLWIEKNLSLKEKIKVLKNSLAKDLLKIVRHYWIKKLEYFFLAFIKSKRLPEKKKQLALFKASYCGIKDYLLRRFYAGPSWLYQKDEKTICQTNFYGKI